MIGRVKSALRWLRLGDGVEATGYDTPENRRAAERLFGHDRVDTLPPPDPEPDRVEESRCVRDGRCALCGEPLRWDCLACGCRWDGGPLGEYAPTLAQELTAARREITELKRKLSDEMAECIRLSRGLGK